MEMFFPFRREMDHNVNELLKPFGGGGHISAAGLKYQTDNVEELKKQILDRVAEMKKKQ